LLTAPNPAGTVRHAGGCLQPVLLRGRVDHVDGATGELLHRYTTVHEPGGVLPIACKTRRASQCPPCAEVYRANTYQLIRAGLSGGKGIPATVATHPCAFATLTAPSFGPVHAHREKDGRVLRCRPAEAAGPADTADACPAPRKHACDDTRLGEPLCPDCYDYTGAVLFNACAPELWRRFAITLRRSLARQAGLTNKALAALREHHRQQAEERLAAGSAWNDTGGLVFTSRWGEPLYPDTVTALMTKLINRHNMSVTPPGKPLPHVRLHDLRHLHATTLQMSRVASDASLPGKRDHGAVREREPGSPAPAAGRQSKTAGQADRDITMLQRVLRCRVQFGCIARQNDAATATPKPHQRGRTLPKARSSR